MYQPFSWLRILRRILFMYSPLLILGLVFDVFFESCLLAALIHIVWLYRQQHTLLKWLYHQRKLSPPTGKGSWEPVFYGIYHLLKRRLNRERELAQRMKFFRLGAEALPDALVVISQDSNILWCNHLARKMLGLKWPTDQGQALTNLIRVPLFVDYMARKVFDKPLELASPVVQGQLLEFRVMPYSEQQFMLVVRDVTQLRQSEKMRKQFVSNVNHELRTPLTVLKGYLEMLDEDELDPILWKKAHATMCDQTTRMHNLVEQLLTLAKIEATPVIKREAVDVITLLQNMENETLAMARDKQLSFDFDIRCEHWVKGDAEQLRSAFSNLINNAVKYCTEPGSIKISWHAHADGACFSVTDSGPGIARGHLLRLTERFYRVDKARSRDTGGAGLGLSIVKHALEHHGSELQIHSELGKGSCFYFVIPFTHLSSPHQ